MIAFNHEDEMKRVLAVWLMVMLLTVAALCGCMTAPTGTGKAVDWSKVSTYYHNYVAGMIAPVGAIAATIVAPECGPLVALATREVGALDALIAAKANDASVQEQSARIYGILQDINAAVGSKGGA